MAQRGRGRRDRRRGNAMNIGDRVDLPHLMGPNGAQDEIPIYRNEVEELWRQVANLTEMVQ